MSAIARRTLLTFLLLFAVAAPAIAESPLPAGAARRFGSTRFQFDGWLTDVAYSPDGLTLITGAVCKLGPNAGKSQLIFWNAATGEKRYDSAFDAGSLYNVVASPDGRTIAANFAGKLHLSIYDAKNGKLMRNVGVGASGSPIYSPDGKVLAGAVGNEILLWDVATGAEVGKLEGHTGTVTWVAFSPTGKHLATLSTDQTMMLWDLESREVLWQQENKEQRWRVVDFTADGKGVAASAITRNDARRGELILWEVAGGAEMMRVPVGADAQGFIFSADGKSLLLVERSSAEVREPATGKLIRRFSLGSRSTMRSWMVSRDGRYFAEGASGCAVHQWDLTTGTLRDSYPGHRFLINSVAVASDGRTVLSADTSGSVRVWEPATGRERSRHQAPKETLFDLPFAPNGQTPYYCVLVEANVLGLVDVETSKERVRLTLPEGETRAAATTADGSLLLAFCREIGTSVTVSIWDAATGKKRNELEKVPVDLIAIALSADGTRLAGSTLEVIHVWDAATGRHVRSFEIDKQLRPQALRFTADGRRLLAIGQETGLGVWEASSGRKVMFATIEGSGIHAAALSPDGRTVAVAPLQNGEPSTVIMLEAATGQERCRLQGHFQSGVEREEFSPYALAFTPDGRSLITTGGDATALVWSLPYRTAVRALPRVAADLPPLWEALSVTEGEPSFGALADLAAVPALAVPLLREQLKPIRPLDEKARKNIARWITELDSDDFDTREKAAAGLEKLEELAAPALRKTLALEVSPEVKRHLTHLVDRLSIQPPVAEVLRAIRVVEILECIATPEARKLLEELAKGAPEACRTQEALGSLARMKEWKEK